MASHTPAPTLLEALQRWTAAHPDKTLYTYLDDSGKEIDAVTYKGMTERTQSVAEYLLSERSGLGLKEGDRVLLVFEPSLHYIIAFLACLTAKLIAVPVFPPDPRKLKKDMFMFVTIANNSGAKVALTTTSYNSYKKMADLRNMFTSEARWPELKWVVVDELKEWKGQGGAQDAHVDVSTIQLDSVAFLQYTSGSTSEPKGVMITHGNLRHNLSSIIHELRADESTVVVSWLPQYHDMGLIGSYLGTLYCGGCGYYMSPFAFLKRPFLWLEMISKYRGTHLQAPNFAYALLLRRFRSNNQKLSLDLSSIRHMINGAEPVNFQDMQSFHETFEPYGLPPDVVFPTYGLAEHVVFVCSGGKQTITVDKLLLEGENRVVQVTPGQEPEETSDLMGCGIPGAERPPGIDPVKVVIARIGDNGPEAKLEEDMVGEVWLDSPSKTVGYWGKSRDDFTATLPGVEGEYLRTGDLGFMHNGELFICGRLKDLIIVRGRNHYPQDIERCVEGISEKMRPGRSAAFGIQRNGEEHVVVVAELRAKEPKATCEDLVQTIRNACTKEQGVTLSALYLCKDRTVPITTSGKIARAWCRKAFLKGTLETLLEWRDEAITEQPKAMVNHAAQAEEVFMDSEQVSAEEAANMTDDELLARLVVDVAQTIHMNPEELEDQTEVALVNLGLDSLSLAQVKGMLEHVYNCPVPDQWMYFETTTVREMMQAVRLGGITEEQADGTPLELQQDSHADNRLLQTCPCLLMCCPGFVMGKSSK